MRTCYVVPRIIFFRQVALIFSLVCLILVLKVPHIHHTHVEKRLRAALTTLDSGKINLLGPYQFYEVTWIIVVVSSKTVICNCFNSEDDWNTNVLCEAIYFLSKGGFISKLNDFIIRNNWRNYEKKSNVDICSFYCSIRNLYMYLGRYKINEKWKSDTENMSSCCA